MSGDNLFGRLFGKQPTGREVTSPVASHELEIPPLKVGLSIQMDALGRVLDMQGPLRHALPAAALDQPLLDYLLPSSELALEGQPEDWLGHTLDLDFRGAEHTVHTRGWLQPHGDGWLLQLLDISDVLQQTATWQNRQASAEFAAKMAEQLRNCGPERLEAVTTEQLQQIAQRWRVPCIGVALPDADGRDWRLFTHFVNHGGPQLWQNGQSLDALLAGQGELGSGEPIRLTAEQTSSDPRWQGVFGNAPAFLVPYREGSEAVAWLLCAFYDPAQQAPDLSDRQWRVIMGALGGPLTSRLREKLFRYQLLRMEVLQGMLGAGWWAYNPTSDVVELAPLLALNLGVDKQRMTMATWLEVVHPADRQELITRLGDLPGASRPLVVEVRIHLARHEQPFTWYRLKAQYLGAGEDRRIEGFMIDISDIRNSEDEAASAHARLDNLIASSPAVIYVQRYVDGALDPEFFSNSLEPLLGWELAQLQGGQMGELIHPDDRDLYFQRTRTLLREGNARARYRLRDRRGEYHYLLDEAKLLRDDLGMPLEAVGLWLDVTEATLAAETVKRSEERYRILVEDSPAMICRYRPDMTLTFANRPLADYLELPVQAVEGANLANWFSAEQREAFLARLATLTPENPVSTEQVCLKLPGREHAWWIWADRGVFDEAGKLVEIQAVGRDNTEVRRSQLQLNQSAKMATLGEMATGLAHEINQPLNVMRMAVANVLKRLSNGDVEIDYLQEKLQRIDAQVQRAAKIVDHMRVFGRRSEIEQHLFDPAQAVEGAMSLLDEGMRGKGVELRVGNVQVDGQVSGYSDQLEQVLINLMVNARDALLGQREKDPELEPWISVSLEREGERVLFWVEDNGGGIDPRLMERIFEPFFTTKPIGVGTGLGLSVSFGIVEQMGGKLSVSNAEHGARFCVELPVA